MLPNKLHDCQYNIALAQAFALKSKKMADEWFLGQRRGMLR